MQKELTKERRFQLPATSTTLVESPLNVKYVAVAK